MNAAELEHVIRAAAEITDDEIVVIGSQAVLGVQENPPAELLESMEADLYPMGTPARAIEIDGVLGDGSDFHEQFGYYGHGVGPETPIPPAGWETRLTKKVYPANELWKKPAVAWFLSVGDGSRKARCWPSKRLGVCSGGNPVESRRDRGSGARARADAGEPPRSNTGAAGYSDLKSCQLELILRRRSEEDFGPGLF